MEACVWYFVWFFLYQHVGEGNNQSFLNEIGQLHKGKDVSGAQFSNPWNKR
jgi:hypothetical protein